MALNSTIRSQLLRVADRWPVDHLRPELSFPNFLRHRAEGRPTLTTDTYTNAAIKEGDAATMNFGKSDMSEQIAALNILLDNKISAKYPLTSRTLRPAAMPQYYERLLKELDVAPGRSWFEGFMNSWKGYIRMR